MLRTLLARLGRALRDPAPPADPPPYGWTRGQIDVFRFGFEQSRADGLLGPYGTPEEKHAAEARFIRDAMEDRLIGAAVTEVLTVIAEGTAPAPTPDAAGRHPPVPYAELDRDGRVGLLANAIDWTEYANRGLPPDTGDRIVVNAADGRPPGQWLDETREETALRVASEHPAFPDPTDPAERERDREFYREWVREADAYSASEARREEQEQARGQRRAEPDAFERSLDRAAGTGPRPSPPLALEP